MSIFAKECAEMISFKWRHFRQDIILMLVRWYVGYSLSYRDIEELALERDLKVDHSTINRGSGLGSNGTANRIKAFLSFLMALTHHVSPHPAWQRNIVQAY